MNDLALTSQLPSQDHSTHQPYLSVQLDKEFSAVFSMDDVHEVLAIHPKQMTPVFNMPACVLGLLTRRSRILWVVDLSQLLLSQPMATDKLPSTQKYNVVIVRINPVKRPNTAPAMSVTRSLLGLIVHEVKGSVPLNLNSLQKPQGNFSPSLTPCLQGSILQDNTLLHILSASALAEKLHQCSTHPLHK